MTTPSGTDRSPTLVDRAALVEAIGYDPIDDGLFVRALSHRSWCAENPGNPSNERLEFLGDAVLGFVVADYVFRTAPSEDEGVLTDVRKAVVNAVCLAEVAGELALGDHMRLGKGEELSGGREKPSILADATEAVLGAVFLDGGMEAARSFVLRLLADRMDAAIAAGGGNQDHKSRLQELVVTITDASLAYDVDASGPDHARLFEATVRAGGRVLGRGDGRSKKQAEQQAARDALRRLSSDGASSDAAILTEHTTAESGPGGTDG